VSLLFVCGAFFRPPATGSTRLTWSDVAERMSRQPARIAGLTDHGHDPVPGAPANLTLVDPGTAWLVAPDALASKSRNTPYAGMELPARVVATFLRGVPTVLAGKLVAK
jgi:dihydroorotase